MTSSYAALYERTPTTGMDALEAMEKNWLFGTRAACGTDTGCLARVYQAQTGRLDRT